MRKDSIVIALGTPHRKREPGKQSPDGRLKECVYGREIASEVALKLQAMGYKCLIDAVTKCKAGTTARAGYACEFRQ